MKTFPQKYDMTAIEAERRAGWANSDVFKWDESLDPALDYVIDTPPPTVSGTLHVGHIYSYTQADILARYMRMSGRNVLYPIGWDDNGLPTERLVEKVKKVRGGTMEREEFRALCEAVIPEYEEQFRDLFARLALSVDWSREYQTISAESRSISQLSFLDLYHKGLVERRMEPALWDPADRTSIAQAEVEEIERDGTLNDIAFAIEGGGELVIATTRPELIGACGAIMIHPDDPRLAELQGKRAISPLYGVPVPVIADPGVDPEKGTGLVMCCTFGDVTDIGWWRSHKLPLRIVMDQAGKMLPDLPIGSDDWPTVDAETCRQTIDALAGQKVKVARETILGILKETGALRKSEVTHQVVPVAERSQHPLEIIVTPQWFIRTLDFKDALLVKGAEIVWRPAFMKQRFDQWVEGLQWDWSISRQRHFGVPLPVWYSKRPGEEGKVILPDPADLPVDPSVELPTGYSENEVEGERDVLDTWATSSVTPQMLTRTINDDFGANPDLHRRLVPMAMRPQAHEIIRTWAFYTIVKALHHQNDVPWRAISISGWCLASDGSKMSKSKGNVIDPIKLLDEYGTDAVRYWTGTSKLGHDTALSPNLLKQGKRLATKLWNASRLAHMALEKAPVDATTPREDVAEGRICHPLDRWLLGRLSTVVKAATEAFEEYEYALALRQIEEFFWSTYCDNYLEFVKSRVQFEGAPDADAQSALLTLHHATAAILRLFAPFQPNVTETLNDLFFGSVEAPASSVHARDQWPKVDDQVDPALERDVGALMTDVIFAVRKVKSNAGVSLRTAISALTITPQNGAADPDALRSNLERIETDLRQTANAARVAVAPAPADLPSSLSASETLLVSAALEEG